MTVKILAFAGSARSDSFNKRLVAEAASLARGAGAEVTLLDLKELNLPLYDQDSESADGLPADVVKLKQLFKEHHALLISSPEYNSSISPLLKNVIDWVSRPADGEQPLECFAGKVAGLFAASPGALGGLRGLVHLRSILGNIKVTVIPEQFALSAAHSAFDDDGKLKDDETRARVAAISKRLFDVTAAISSINS